MSIAIRVGSGAAIPNYASLVARVADWLDRDDLDPNIPVYVGLLEARLNRLLRVPDMEVRTDLPVAGSSVALPRDVLAIRSLGLVQNGVTFPLDGMVQGGVLQAAPGPGRAYTLRGRELTLHAAPPGPATLRVVYWQRIPPLSEATPVNWLLDRHSDVYLYGALLEASAQLDDPERIRLWKAALDEALSEVTAEGVRNRWGAGPLVPHIVRQTSGARC